MCWYMYISFISSLTGNILDWQLNGRYPVRLYELSYINCICHKIDIHLASFVRYSIVFHANSFNCSKHPSLSSNIDPDNIQPLEPTQISHHCLWLSCRDGSGSKWPPVLKVWEQLCDNCSKVGQNTYRQKAFAILLLKMPQEKLRKENLKISI